MNERLEAIKSSILDSLDKAKTALNNKEVAVESLKVSEIPGYIRQIELNKIKLTVTCSEFVSGTIKATKDGKERVGTVQDGQCIIMLPSTGTWHIEHDLGDYVETEVNGDTSVELVKKKVTFSEGECSEEKITIHVDSVTGNNSNDNFIRVKKNGVVIEVQAQLKGSDIEITNFEYEEGATYTIEYVIKDEVRGSIEVEIVIEIVAGSSTTLFDNVEGITKESNWGITSYKGLPEHIVFTDQQAPPDSKFSYWGDSVKWLDKDTSTLYISSQDSSKKIVMPEDCTRLFDGGLTGDFVANGTTVDIDFSNADFSQTTNASGLFYNCNKITQLDLKDVDMSNVTNIKEMFRQCSSLTQIDITNVFSEKITNADYLFSYCSQLQNIDLGMFDCSNISSLSNMFRSCSLLQNINGAFINTENVTEVSNMFDACSKLSEIDFSNFIFSSVTDSSSMFRNCFTLSKIYANEWANDNKIESSRDGNMFDGCSSLPNYNSNNVNISMAKWKENGGYFTNPSEKPN